MAAHASGDAHAFRTLYRRYADRLRAFFRKHAAGNSADDLVQTTFVRLHNARYDYRPDLPLRPFLYALAFRARIDEARRVGRAQRVTPSAPEGEADSPEAEFLAQELSTRLQRALAALSEKQRQVVVLHRFEQLTFAEIAQTLSLIEGETVTEGAARVRAFRAYDALRAALAADTPETETNATEASP